MGQKNIPAGRYAVLAGLWESYSTVLRDSTMSILFSLR